MMMLNLNPIHLFRWKTGDYEQDNISDIKSISLYAICSALLNEGYVLLFFILHF
jgi:hypothetical protein